MAGTSLNLRIAQALDLVGEQGLPQDANGNPVRNAPSPLKVFIPFIRARGERRQRRLAATIENGHDNGQTLALAADHQWHDSGLQLEAGDRVHISASGRLFLNKALEVSIGPRTSLWYRIGEGEIARLPAEQGVVTASSAGPLRLQAAIPGAFGSPQGEISAENPPPPMTGELQVQLSPVEAAQNEPVSAPTGWQYLWRVGEASIFKTCEAGESLCCDTHGDAAILQYPLDLPLTDDLVFRWEWLMEALPSSLPEHVQPTHDYLSIAIEFDNGLDLTYMWSCGLPVDTVFQCPLPWWDQRETHWVLRTPDDGLGQWHAESRQVKDDYRRSIGGPLPKRVVSVWLIANSAFQSGRGSCRYRGIAFKSAEGRHEIPV